VLRHDIHLHRLGFALWHRSVAVPAHSTSGMMVAVNSNDNRKPDDRICQLEVLATAGDPPSAVGVRTERLKRVLLLQGLRLKKLVTTPSLLPKRALERIRARRAPQDSSRGTRVQPEVLGLEPGDRIQVKSVDEIAATLDDEGKFEGLAYIPALMDRYCGQTYTVRKRAVRFFDERSWRMVKVKNVVLLDEVFCEPSKHVDCDWAGCDRTCFLFWKEGWLRRVVE